MDTLLMFRKTVNSIFTSTTDASFLELSIATENKKRHSFLIMHSIFPLFNIFTYFLQFLCHVFTVILHQVFLMHLQALKCYVLSELPFIVLLLFFIKNAETGQYRSTLSILNNNNYRFIICILKRTFDKLFNVFKVFSDTGDDLIKLFFFALSWDCTFVCFHAGEDATILCFISLHVNFFMFLYVHIFQVDCRLTFSL